MPGADTRTPPRRASPATPPEEGNTTPSGCACHPSRGGELAVRYFFNGPMMQPPRQAKPATPPQEGNCRVQIRGHHPVRLCLPPLQRRGISGAILFQRPHDATTPSGEACHPSRGGEYQPVRLRLPLLHRRGIVRSYQLW